MHVLQQSVYSTVGRGPRAKTNVGLLLFLFLLSAPRSFQILSSCEGTWTLHLIGTDLCGAGRKEKEDWEELV